MFSAATQSINCPKCLASILLNGDTIFRKIVSAEKEILRLREELEVELKATRDEIAQLKYENKLLQKYNVSMGFVSTKILNRLQAENKELFSALKSAKGFVDAHDNVGFTRVKVDETLKRHESGER